MGKGGLGLGPERRGGAKLRRGSPTVWNAAYNHLQYWDGRARDLEDQDQNFGDPGSIVSGVPSGTGIMILAGDDVEVTGNEIRWSSLRRRANGRLWRLLSAVGG